MFIMCPGFGFSNPGSRTQQQKERGKNLVFLKPQMSQNSKLFFDQDKKTGLSKLTKNVTGKYFDLKTWHYGLKKDGLDPGSRKKLIPDPGSGSRRQKSPGPGSATPQFLIQKVKIFRNRHLSTSSVITAYPYFFTGTGNRLQAVKTFLWSNCSDRTTNNVFLQR
jgi:hypothetical protein